MKNILTIITALIFAIIVFFMVKNNVLDSRRSLPSTPIGGGNDRGVVVTPLSGVQDPQAQILGAASEQDSVTFNVDAIFNKALIIKDKITADNIVYGIKTGSGISVGAGQTPVITNTGVTSLAGKSGELKLEQGSGITIDGLKITNSGIISLTSGTGITVSGSTITNSDLGSSQNIFKTLSVSGQDNIVAGSNTDILTFTAGSGITLTTDSTNDKLTISSNDPNIAAGWTHGTDSIYLTTSTDSVGIGTTDPSYKLHVVGTEYVSDTLTAGGDLSVTGNTTLTGSLSANGNVTLGNATTDSLTFVGRITNGTSLVPGIDLGSNLGTETNRFNNLWVANINSNRSQAFSGQTTFSYAPQDTTTDEASVFINPASSVANGQLLGFGIAGYQKALIDAEGDMILGYNNTNVNPTRVDTEVLSLYGHSGTKVAYIDTSGNLNITGGYSIAGNSVLNATTLGTGVLNSSLTSTGTLNSGSITSGFGSIDTGSDNIVTTGTVGSSGLTSFTGNSLAINSITSTGNISILPTDNVGIGTATPTSKLSVVGDISSSVATGVEGLKLTDTSDVTKLAMKWTGTGVTFDVPSLSTVNQLTNGTFETDITTGGWGSYTLNDQFTTDKTSAQLVGTQTSAEPTGGTRTVTDSASSWSVSGGVLSSLGLGSANDPRLYYQGISSARSLGRIYIGNIKAYASTYFGWGNGSSRPQYGGFTLTSTYLSLNGNSGNLNAVLSSVTAGSIYQLAVIQKPAGNYYFAKGGTQFPNWTLLYQDSLDASSLYPGIGYMGTNGTTADNIRIPSSTWLPTPLAYDAFGTSSSSTDTTGPDSQTTPQLTWVGGTKSGGGTLTITPSLGSEKYNTDASAFTSGTYSWVAAGGNTIENDVNTLKITYVDNSNGAYSYFRDDLSSGITVGNWYQYSYDSKVNAGSNVTPSIYAGTNDTYGTNETNTTFTNHIITSRNVNNSSYAFHAVNMNAGEMIWFDNLSLKPLTLSSLFSTVPTSDSDVIADVTISALTSGTQAGLVLNLDSAESPDDFIIVYHDGTKLYVDEAVNGAYTNKQNTTVALGAGALRVIRDGTKLRVYLNNALVGAELTMTANTNTKHGLFSTYSTNTFDNFTLWARGTGNEYVNLPAEDLTATRDTSVHYSGSSSLKLVAGTSGNGYTQSYTLPNTSNYTLSAFAYTDGSAVTASDLSLENGDVNLETSYTSVGNGWYKLSASFAGVASARNYGVKVKAGKTVYVDNISLYLSTSASVSTLAIGNSTTGLGGLSVESTTTLNSGMASLQALIVKGFSGQTEDLTEWHTSTGSVLASISSTGGFTSEGNLDVNGTTNDIAGTLNLSGNSLTSSGALTISPTAGSNVSFSLSGTGDMIVNTNDLVVDTSSGFVGIGTALPTALLDLAGTSGTDAFRLTNSGAKVLGLSYGTNATTFDIVSTDPTNKASNGTFETDLTGWDIPYTLNDEFTTDKTSAQLVGTQTSAEPTGGTRTVVDTNSKLSITGGKLSFATGGVTEGNPGLWYPIQTRVAGKLLVGTVVPSGSNDIDIGWDNGQAGTIREGQVVTGGTALGLRIAGNGIYTGTTVSGTSYQFASVLRSTGMYYFIKGGTFTNWTLLYISSSSTGNMYPGIAGSTTGVATADNIRIPTALWLPTPLAYDDFASADMTTKATGPDTQTAPQLSWTGGSDAGEVMKITPSLGDELIVNGGFDTDTDWTKGTGWTIDTADSNVAEAASGTAENLYRGMSVTVGKFYYAQFDIVTRTAGALKIQVGGNGIASSADESAVGTHFVSGRSISIGGGTVILDPRPNFNGTIDNVSVKELTLSSLFSSVSTSDSDVIADADVTVTAGTQAGIVTNLNDTTTPTNFRIIYTDGTTIKMDDVVGGTYTNKLSVLHSSATALNYVAGRTLRVITQGTTMRVYYNNTLVGSEITTLGANTNTKHGLFSTYELNSFDNFTLWARGTGNEYTSAPFEELTATRNTTTKYNNSTASVELVGGATDGVYSQSINVGNTNTQNVIAFAYTNGSAVTSADLSLYYDTAAITTSYTPMGATGWYKLTGSVTGVASAKEYGVVVKAGKTVYVDDFKVQEGVGTTQNMYVMNSNTGVTGLNVQGLINGTLNGVATLSKAGTISDSDFEGGVTDGMMAIDTTNHRVYFREGGSWSYSAKAGGFQIPKEEVLGLSTGDYLLPYVDNFMSDGAVHGMYQKFDLNKLLATQGAVTFVSDVTFLGKTVFNKDTAGTAIISTYSSSVDVKFENTYDVSPIVTMNLVIDASDSAFIEDGQKAYLTNVTPSGFTIMLPDLAMKDFMYKWIAIPIKEKNVTKSQPVTITPTILP